VPAAPEAIVQADEVRVFAQRTLDRTHALEAATRARADGASFLWVSTGAVARSFVGPLIVPRAGPCLGCLFEIFQRRSPFAVLHDELDAHAARGGRFAEASPGPLVERVLAAIVAWKLEQARAPMPSAALFRLHVVEHEALETSTHPVARLDDCACCAPFARDAARTSAP
jgi:bacteriocin biosynthesis cyclodehydratase domain-containing protein